MERRGARQRVEPSPSEPAQPPEDDDDEEEDDEDDEDDDDDDAFDGAHASTSITPAFTLLILSP